MPFHDRVTVLPMFRIGNVTLSRDEHGRVTFGLGGADEEEPEMDFGSPERNEYVLQNIGTLFRYIDVFDQDYMRMVLSEQFPPTARPVLIRSVNLQQRHRYPR